MESVFVNLSLIILVALIASIVARILKQPLIVAYIVSGVILSPYFFGLVDKVPEVSIFAQMGVAVLMFMVGLNLDPKVIKEVGLVSLVTGIGQIIFTVFVGFFLGIALGFSWISAIYIAIAISFSSTIIIMKVLSDKGDISTLYGKISVGFLIVQDLVAIVILLVVSSLSKTDGLSSFALEKFGIGFGSIVALVFVTIYILPSVMKRVAKNQELLMLFSIGWAFALGSLFDFTGFSMEIGALLAGISLSISPYRHEIGSKMKPLRDFFLLLFFILLGSKLSFSSLNGMILPSILFSLLIFIGNPLSVMFLMGRIGYTKRNSFLAGLTVSQISEFSFILIALGIKLGQIPVEILSLMTVIGLVTMGGSAYFVSYGNKIYHFFSPYLNIFERKGLKKDEGRFYLGESYDIILFGYNRIGYSLLKSFKNIKKKFLVVDNNPEVIIGLAKSGVNCQYGDAEDVELLEELPVKNAKMIISTIPDTQINLLLVKKIHSANKEAIVVVVSHGIEDALKLYSAGATYVVLPHFLGGTYTSNLIEQNIFEKENFVKEGLKHIEELKARRKEGHKDVSHERG